MLSLGRGEQSHWEEIKKDWRHLFSLHSISPTHRMHACRDTSTSRRSECKCELKHLFCKLDTQLELSEDRVAWLEVKILYHNSLQSEEIKAP